ncbi:MAG: M13 family metallopeptidase [Acidobacteria bacterium]|nr:M13 family metallopeptidase [Acidobacteriota bacterium]
MRRYISAFILAGLPLAATAHAQPSPAPASGVDLGALNRSADACSDFYEFACGGWLAKNPLPADRRNWGRFAEVQERNFATLRRILESRSGDADERKAGDYYASCMDEAAIDTAGVRPLAPTLERIGALQDRADLPALLAGLHGVAMLPSGPGRAPYSALFDFESTTDLKEPMQKIANVDQGGMALPDRDTYLKTDERTTVLREKYQAHVEQVLVTLGLPAAEAADGARAVLTLETALARAAADPVTRRDPDKMYHPMSPADLQALSPHFDWTSYFAATSAPAFSRVDVNVPAFVQAMDAIVANTPLSDIKHYLRWQVAHASALMLPKAIRNLDFDFFARTLRGQQEPTPRVRLCIADTDERLGEALGKAYVQAAFGPQAKADMLKMVAGIKAAMREDIRRADWMTEPTKNAATRKLDAVADRIGYPDLWRSYAAVRIDRSDALGNFQRALAFERQRDLMKIGRPIDRSEWHMTPPTVNAYYSPLENNINFPAGILQLPFYSAARDAAVNYGAIGAVIGHELTHGFDDQGRRFDTDGSLRDWWTADDADAFEDRADCIADQYSEYVVEGDTRVNGRLTLGENTADNGGLRLALMAYLAGPGATPQPMLDGFTPAQRVFLGWAQSWCEVSRPETERIKAATNPHASNRYRVIGPLSNMPEFQKAFSCKAGSPMVREQTCRVW